MTKQQVSSQSHSFPHGKSSQVLCISFFKSLPPLFAERQVSKKEEATVALLFLFSVS